MNKVRKNTVLALSLVVVSSSSLGSCTTATARLDQFEAFAQVGQQYADAVPGVVDSSFVTTVTTSSLLLAQTRPYLSPEERLSAIEEDDSLLMVRVKILNDIKRHANLLKVYFASLAALAQTDAESSGIIGVTDGLVSSLGEVSSSFRNATIGGKDFSSLTAPTVTLAVATFQAKALENELKRHGPTIERELQLQEAVLGALADAMRADLETQFALADRDSIVLPYVRDDTLPSDWSQRRMSALGRQLMLSSVDAAWRVAEQLRLSFVALVENRFGHAAITALLEDINGILEYVKATPGNQEGV